MSEFTEWHDNLLLVLCERFNKGELIHSVNDYRDCWEEARKGHVKLEDVEKVINDEHCIDDDGDKVIWDVDMLIEEIKSLESKTTSEVDKPTLAEKGNENNDR